MSTLNNIQFSSVILKGIPLPLAGARDGARLSLSADDRYTVTPTMTGNIVGKVPARSATIAIGVYPSDAAAKILQDLVNLDDASQGLSGNVPGIAKYTSGRNAWTMVWTEGRIINTGEVQINATAQIMTYVLQVSGVTIKVDELP